MKLFSLWVALASGTILINTVTAQAAPAPVSSNITVNVPPVALFDSSSTSGVTVVPTLPEYASGTVQRSFAITSNFTSNVTNGVLLQLQGEAAGTRKINPTTTDVVVSTGTGGSSQNGYNSFTPIPTSPTTVWKGSAVTQATSYTVKFSLRLRSLQQYASGQHTNTLTLTLVPNP
ncbi:MAG TPA: hypothetical protein VF681_15960 [Abditibacteriaceae bacterium]|jgi:hypothetical protein